MFSPFITRKPWASALIGLLFSPVVGMLYLGKGKAAISYVGLSAFLLASPFVLAHMDLYNSDPRPLAENLPLFLKIVGAVHCYFIAKCQAAFTSKWFSRWYSIILLTFIIPLSVALLFRVFFYAPFDIPGKSMEPTLKQGDYIYVSKRAFKSGNLPQRNDVVIFTVKIKGRTEDYVKRIVGLPGEKVRVEGDNVYINENAIGSRYPESDIEILHPHQLAAQQYFVIGDNKDQSHDSRNGLGDVMLPDIVGKPVAVIWNSKTYKFSYRPIQ
jgi:signal peptidase I